MKPREYSELRYVTDAEPGLERLRKGKGFVYITSTGRLIHDQTLFAHIRALAIPPAWTSVWTCRHANGHLQATGRDAPGRKQYRYHPQWTLVRDRSMKPRSSERPQLQPDEAALLTLLQRGVSHSQRSAAA